MFSLVVLCGGCEMSSSVARRLLVFFFFFLVVFFFVSGKSGERDASSSSSSSKAHHHHHHHRDFEKMGAEKSKRISSLSPCVVAAVFETKEPPRPPPKIPQDVFRVASRATGGGDEEHTTFAETRQNTQRKGEGFLCLKLKTLNKRLTFLSPLSFRPLSFIVYTHKKWQQPRTSTSLPRNRK